MKQLLFLAMLACLALQACTSSTGKYEKEIKEYIENDNVFKMDLDVKVSDIKVSDVTVADSIAILKNAYDKRHADELKATNSLIAAYEQKLEDRKTNTASWASSSVEYFQKELETLKAKLKQLQTETPPYQEKYKGESDSKVLAQIVTCMISLKNPTTDKVIEKETRYLFSANGSKCLDLID